MYKPSKLEKEHIHIWKYLAKQTNGIMDEPYMRVCEAPFPTIPSCGRTEVKNSKDEWVIKEDTTQNG